ncbi:23S rRNA (uracil1939-C5)-methyltransferase [Pseudoalteromonas sp. BSi20311]|uniref:23S rRNA (uracil(1939)-C(5))-methyltransferase RlmD n=1 Tax=unclassified Pseudoalteromonas TaxID=194690 RepID=UPI000231BB60|nr:MULTISPECIES: 23S rRNA (uracil(1939)-C(5))-methyltransferase RlmD [unclassified Pseudoalteromonas]TMS94527.1 23S rRNA (uracil(1939)-C(5))-methyltransferase RlmD [Pseudoalteromonas sp. S201]GAA63939.1 23S rRNA (uracil1939-C5)-methyltransferase [Pseudoalteromonas sp. BSi20311]HCP96131.1 23S rRNA (uracil(1939)-C(5))-methyltransferase RlmD [Pseudoalteromonas sp.]|tara:strand:- start:350 stop:1675 length:1326 start_codon:yes stop_codon:yes gene_type:complete
MAQIFKAKKKPLQQQSLELDITAMDHHGRGIAKYNNKVCFVSGALPGERVKAKLVDDKARYSQADTLKIIKASEYRTAPICEHYSQCGGCQLQHLDTTQQVIEKQAAVNQLFAKFAKLTDLNWQAPLQSQATHYRRSARVAVMFDKAAKKMRVGYRARGSKSIVSINQCPVLSDVFADVFNVFDKVINQHKTLHSISHLQLCAADEQYFIVIRHTKAISPTDKAFVEQSVTAHNWQLVWQSDSDTIDHSHLAMPFYKLEQLNITFEFGLSNFIQVNASVNQAMLIQAVKWLALQGDENVLDLFCGIGNFSLVLAKQAKTVTGIEGVASAVALATQNAHTNSITNTQFHCFDLTTSIKKAPWFNKELDVLVLDPSRTGAMAVLEQLPLTQFKAILYVSCDPVTLARDSAIISQAGFELNKIGLMNMFPHTGHIETMALFQRR